LGVIYLLGLENRKESGFYHHLTIIIIIITTKINFLIFKNVLTAIIKNEKETTSINQILL
jgi:hypothetical protein